jgi:hypothetical protein
MYLNKALSHELQYCFSHCFTDMSESHLAAIGRGGVIKERFFPVKIRSLKTTHF